MDNILHLFPLFQDGKWLLGKLAVPSLTEVAAQLPLRRQVAQTQEAQGVTEVPTHPAPIEKEGIPVTGLTDGFCSVLLGHNRCLSHRMVCCVAEPDSSKTVVSTGLHEPCQHARAEGCAPGA